MSNRQTTPFTLYEDSLVFFGRVMESSCKWSMQMLDAMEQAAETAVDEEKPPAPPVAVTAGMIPSTGDLENAAAAVAAAMNGAAQEKLGRASLDEEPLEDVREAVARAKRSISAAKPRGDN